MDFDPYRQWLSLDDPPSDFYVLLGLRTMENDTDLIRSAASQVVSRVRSAKPGNHISAWKRLLDQIEQARESLCDPVKKQRYDQRLRDEIDAFDLSLTVSGRHLRSTRSHTMAKQVPDPMSPLDDADFPGPEIARPSEPAASANPAPKIQRRTVPLQRSRRARPTRRHMRWTKPFALVVGAVAFLSVAWSLWLVLQSNDQLLSLVFDGQPRAPSASDKVATRRPKDSVVTAPPKAVESNDHLTLTEEPVDDAEGNLSSTSPTDAKLDSPPPPTKSEAPPTKSEGRQNIMTPVEPGEVSPKMERPPDSGDAVTAQLSEAELRQFRRSLREARRLLTTRQFGESKQQLANAQQLAKTPELEAMVERLDTLHQFVRGFWSAVDDGMVDIENTELVMEGKRMFVVELTPQQIILRVEGRNRRFNRNKLPTKLAMAIADRWFDQNAASTKVFKGAFMAVSPGVAEQQVRQLWQQAQQEGVDLGDLMQVLDDRDWKPAAERP